MSATVSNCAVESVVGVNSATNQTVSFVFCAIADFIGAVFFSAQWHG